MVPQPPQGPVLDSRRFGRTPFAFLLGLAACSLLAFLVLVLVALLPCRRTEIDGAHDGVVYASMVGLGFALVANVYAVTVGWNAGAGAIAEQFARRGIFGPVFQALFTSMIGLGIAYAAARKGATGYWAIAVGWVAAVALATLWNYSVAFGGAGLALAVAV